MFSILLL